VRSVALCRDPSSDPMRLLGIGLVIGSIRDHHAWTITSAMNVVSAHVVIDDHDRHRQR